jgi:UTP--glucose-1-phosphate uridylyltransferase
MRLTKAVITAAAKHQSTLPLQVLIDRDGVQKTALQILIEDVLCAGIQDIGVVIRAEDEAVYTAAAGEHARRLHFVSQPSPRGYGHAIFCARSFVGKEPFLHLVGDHLSVSRLSDKSCAQQLVEVAEREDAAVSAVQATRETLLPNFGAVGGKRVAGQPGLYVIDNVLEKPTPTEAEQVLTVPGLRAGHFLCFFGMHVLTPAAMTLLETHLANSASPSATPAPVQLSDSLAELARRERYLAYEIQGQRYDLGVKYGLLNAQLALALSGNERADVLAQMIELIAK